MSKRPVDIVVISDVHLGTYGCHAHELVQYLKSIQPGMLVLNGDIIDIWQFSKRYWPKSHMQVLKEIVKIVAREIPVYYLTGNHDELLRKFTPFSLGNFHLLDQLVLETGGSKTWLFHGDVFDASMQQHTKWLAHIGSWSYDLLILLNRGINRLLEALGRGKMSFSKTIKNSVKSAVSYISDFEQAAATYAVEHGYDHVICGHIHQPQIKTLVTPHGQITYLNSGDWVENLTALEYHEGQWSVFTWEMTRRDPLQTPADVSEETEIPHMSAPVGVASMA
ncbi:MAG: UDP-2,3-diacylglucosamine diphosphatase [Bacteroidia bacterium]|nr:UDP-2,3-diacylglucosamine diphosphatase [Bacteroidia bacterium]